MKANVCPVTGPRGFRGTIDLTRWPNLDQLPPETVDVILPDRHHVMVPAEALIEQKDGSFYLAHPVPGGRTTPERSAMIRSFSRSIRSRSSER